jgi:hypothetical protein
MLVAHFDVKEEFAAFVAAGGTWDRFHLRYGTPDPSAPESYNIFPLGLRSDGAVLLVCDDPYNVAAIDDLPPEWLGSTRLSGREF